MRTMIALLVVFAITAAVLAAWSIRMRANHRHDPIEYFLGWTGYSHPVTLEKKITKEEADAIAARGAAYLIGYNDGVATIREYDNAGRDRSGC